MSLRIISKLFTTYYTIFLLKKIIFKKYILKLGKKQQLYSIARYVVGISPSLFTNDMTIACLEFAIFIHKCHQLCHIGGR